MKSKNSMMRVASLLLLALLAAGQVAYAQTPVLQLQSTNYNPVTGIWTATIGSNATNAPGASTLPTLVTGVTPNGSPAVVFNGANFLTLASSIAAGNGYTAIAYIKPSTTSGTLALFGGAQNAFEYRISSGQQDALKQQTADLGHGTAVLSTSAFSIVAVTVTNSGTGGYRLNGATDAGTTAASTFTQPISAIGARSSGTGVENFNGAISEIDIYAGVLTPAQISVVELAISNSYITSILGAPTVLVQPIASPSTATVGGNDTLTAYFDGTLPISYQWQVSANAGFSPATSITAATNSILTLTNLQLTDSGKYYRVIGTNTYAPYNVTSAPVQLTVQALAPMVQLIATNYDGSSVWTDSSGNGNNATFAGTTAPTLVPFVTPNGGSAVNITTSGSRFVLASSLAPSTATGNGYTVFAYFKPTATNGSSRFALTGGTGSGTGALEYDYYQGHQNYLREFVGGGGAGTGFIPTNNFVLTDVAANGDVGTFRLNGAADGSPSGSVLSFPQPITRIGNNQGNGDTFIGQIAEIDIYSGVLTFTQITNIEGQLTAKYITANSVVVGAATTSPTNNTYAGNPITISAPVLGATSTTAYQWQTDNGSSGASFSNISGANTTNYFVLNTAGLAPSSATAYEYQLIVTPFGGTAVTSAPVTLTVQPASAPVVLMDTTPNPATATVGGNLSFSASFTGTLPISGYQWQVSPNSDGSAAVNIAGATNTTLVLSNLQLANSGNYYSLQATNAIAPYVANSSWAQLTVQPLTALVQLIATNYNPITGVWTDYSGNNNNATYGVVQSGSLVLPSLVSSVTPNGSSAVNITAGNGSFVLTTPLDASSGYTVFAYIEPSSTSGRNAITGGSAQYALEYDVYNGNQNYLNEYSGTEQASGTGTIPTSNYSLIDLAASSSGVSFRLNAASDGTSSGATFSQPITRIGNNEGGGDGLVGQVAEIDIYNGALSSIQITNIEAQLIASYGTAGIPPVVTGLQFTAKPVISGTSLTISATNTGAGSIYLLTSTNIALPLSSWTPIWTNSTSGSGSFTTNLLNTVNPALGRQFYILGSTN